MLNDRITKSFCSRPLTNVLTLKSNARPDGPHFGSNSTLYGAKLSPNAQGMPGGGGGGGLFLKLLVHNKYCNRLLSV